MMRKIKANLISMTVLALLVAPGFVSQASAGVRVRATWQTPGMYVQVGNHGRKHKRHNAYVSQLTRLTNRDRNMARRLSNFFDAPKGKMLKLRKRGYGWIAIGDAFGIPRQAVRAARTNKSWKRFLYNQRCIIEPRPQRYRGNTQGARIEYEGNGWNARVFVSDND
jgi:hypothetical protein